MRKAGYIWLKEKFEIHVLDYWITSYVQDTGAAKSIYKDGHVEEVYRPNAWPGEGWMDHLEFALRREGLHLELLRKLMPLLEVMEVTRVIQSKPTGKYTRILWYLYESFTEQILDIPDLKSGNYFPLADPKVYLTTQALKVSRQRIDVNLLGSIHFTPMVRCEDLDYEQINTSLKERCEQSISEFPAVIFKRAVNYLYVKESKSSYAIEREQPSEKRARAFVNLLERAWSEDFLTKQSLVKLQNVIVEQRYSNKGYRDELNEQIYIGESLAPGHERVHYVGPKPSDVEVLMQGYLECVRGILDSQDIPDLAAAAIVSYLFNFIHPFSDGNGRIHRFLMHHTLAKYGFGREGIALPISAVILSRPQDYDKSLESFSKKLMDKIDYDLDDRLRMTVSGETIDHYRYIDCTKIVATFIDFTRETIENQLPAEVNFLQRYDACRSAMREIVDMPDRYAELLLKICRQNGGKLSKNKRSYEEFEALSDQEVIQLEGVIIENFPEIW